MQERKKQLEEKILKLKNDLIQLEKSLHTQYKTLQPQIMKHNRARIERLIKRRPSVEDLIYRGIYVSDPHQQRRSREIAKEKLDELLAQR